MLLDVNVILDKLVERYPNKLPSKEVNINDVYKLQGQQEVINYLTTLVDTIMKPKKKQ